MIVSFEEIKDVLDGVVRFYTVRLGEAELTEFEQFDAKDFPLEEHQKELQIIYL